MNEDSITGCILGAALGDSMGLAYEGISKRRAARLFPGPLRHHFLFGKGMVSDDTEHTVMVAQAILASGGDVSIFKKDFARRLRKWFLCLPPGVGFGTLKSALRLTLGFSPDSSGVFTAGNGPAMRSSIIGVIYGDDEKLLREYVRAATRITHTDPKAEFGALSVAIAAHMASTENAVKPAEFLSRLKATIKSNEQSASEFISLMELVVSFVETKKTVEDLAERLGQGKGISGYTYHTVPVALYVWLTNQGDFKKSIEAIIRCGGDADTTAAIVGGITGAGIGETALPQDWLAGIVEWPMTVERMKGIGRALAKTQGKVTSETDEATALLILPRNLFFLAVVFAHIFRRMLPPY